MREFAGDANFVDPASLIGDRTRARILLALLDRRSLPMSTMSGHLAQLVEGGLLRVETQGRHRYYSIASPQVAHAMEALAQLAPPFEPRSLRTGTKARALRTARSCYNHLAGHLGVVMMQELINQGFIDGGDGKHDPRTAARDRLAAPGRDLEYRVTEAGWRKLSEIGVEKQDLRRPRVGYCVDWTEQQHHLSGVVGTAILGALLKHGWLERVPNSRALRIAPAGESGFHKWLGVDARSPNRQHQSARPCRAVMEAAADAPPATHGRSGDCTAFG